MAAPALLTNAVALALADLEEPSDGLVRVELEELEPGSWLTTAEFADTGAGNAVAIDELSDSEVVARVAEVLQQAFIERAREARPPCPGHEHPMVAAVQDGQAIWRCPAGEDTTIPIGSYRN